MRLSLFQLAEKKDLEESGVSMEQGRRVKSSKCVGGSSIKQRKESRKGGWAGGLLHKLRTGVQVPNSHIKLSGQALIDNHDLSPSLST